MKKLDVEPYEGNDYIAIVHPEIAEDIVSDTTWINWHQYTSYQDEARRPFNGKQECLAVIKLLKFGEMLKKIIPSEAISLFI